MGLKIIDTPTRPPRGRGCWKDYEMIPIWLRGKLADNGRRATLTECPKCKQSVIAGLDHDTCGIRVMVDLNEISRLGELLATLTGVKTFDLTKYGGKWELQYRYPSNVHADREYPVLVAHVCGAEWPGEADHHELILRNQPSSLSAADQPPF